MKYFIVKLNFSAALFEVLVLLSAAVAFAAILLQPLSQLWSIIIIIEKKRSLSCRAGLS